jgi:hypothetical protein
MVRAARDSAFSRDVNERIAMLNAAWLSDADVAFVCECENPGCREPVYATVVEFEAVKGTPGRLLIALCHVDRWPERVGAIPRYVVAEQVSR